LQDFVSTRWIRVVGLVASMSLVLTVFTPSAFPWMGLACVTLAVSGALWLRKRSPRSIAQVLDAIEAEPARSVATRVPVAPAAPKVGHH
jgi:hypothetical protein